jgi:hypothetical protein
MQGEKGGGRMEKSISPIQLMSHYRRTQLVRCARKWTLLTVSYNLLLTDTNSHARPPSGSIVFLALKPNILQLFTT